MNKIKATLEKQNANEGDKITMSFVLEHILREANLWSISLKDKKSKKDKKGKKVKKTFRN